MSLWWWGFLWSWSIILYQNINFNMICLFTMIRDISFSHQRVQLSIHAFTSPFIAMNYKFIPCNSLLSSSVILLATYLQVFLLYLCVVRSSNSVVPSLYVSCCLSSLLCCSFTICELFFELPTQLYLYYLWVVV